MTVNTYKTISKNVMQDYSGKQHVVPCWSIDDFVIEGANLHSAIAYKLNGDLKNGYYLEMGVGHYKNNNNTYFLETFHDWKGLSLDISEHVVKDFNDNRKNECVLTDATTFNWIRFLERSNYPKVIDFLSIDIDFETNNYLNLFALLNLPLLQYKFKVISIEHNAGIFYNLTKCRDIQRDVLTSLGYHLLAHGEVDDIWCLEKVGSMNGFDQLPPILSGRL